MSAHDQVPDAPVQRVSDFQRGRLLGLYRVNCKRWLLVFTSFGHHQNHYTVYDRKHGRCYLIERNWRRLCKRLELGRFSIPGREMKLIETAVGRSTPEEDLVPKALRRIHELRGGPTYRDTGTVAPAQGISDAQEREACHA